MARLYFIFFCVITIKIFSNIVHAQDPTTFTKLFKNEEYSEAIAFMETYEEQKLPPGKKAYFLAISKSRLQRFDEAIVHFEEAQEKKCTNEDLNYEYGQALYAINNLAEARYEFLKSIGSNFNYIASTYYVAHISEILEDYVTAKYHYRRLIKYKKIDRKMLQIALFQYTKVLLKMMKREEASLRDVEIKLAYLDINLINHIPRYIIPLLQKALAIDQKSSISTEIAEFIQVLLDEYKIDPNVMANGRKISDRKIYASISQALRYDDNIELTKKSSMLYKTDVFAKYDLVAKKRIVFSPEIRMSYLKHIEQESAEVYQFDSFSFTPAGRIKLEHTYNSKPATISVDLEYNRSYRDWKKTRNKDYYSKNFTIGVGEQLSLSSSSETSFGLRRTNYENQLMFSNYKLTSASVDHYAFLRDGSQLLIGTLELSQFNFYETPSLNNNVYTLRFIHLMFEVIPTYTFQTIISFSVTDTKEQKKTRGNEINLNPSFEIIKAFTNQLRLSTNFSFTTNSSKQEDYKYQKKVFGTSLSYTF